MGAKIKKHPEGCYNNTKIKIFAIMETKISTPTKIMKMNRIDQILNQLPIYTIESEYTKNSVSNIYEWYSQDGKYSIDCNVHFAETAYQKEEPQYGIKGGYLYDADEIYDLMVCDEDGTEMNLSPEETEYLKEQLLHKIEIY